jgi:hypothetical protein
MSGVANAERVGRLRIAHGGKNWEVELRPGIATIGRYAEGSTNTINLAPTDLSISRHHAEILVSNGSYELKNVSSNGTSLNGRRVDRAALAEGDLIKIGTAELRFHLVEAAPAGVRDSGIRLGRPSMGPSVDDEEPTPMGVPIVSQPAAVAPPQDGDFTAEFDFSKLRKTTINDEVQPAAAAPSAPVQEPAVAPAPAPAEPDADDEDQLGRSAGYGIRESAQEVARAKARAKAKEKEKQGEKKGVSPVILVAVGIAFLLFLGSLVMGPRKSTPDSGGEIKALLTSYEGYLKKKNDPGVDVPERLDEVKRRLEAIAWAERVGEKNTAEHELQVLLMMDGDRSSPVHSYAVNRLSSKR